MRRGTTWRGGRTCAGVVRTQLHRLCRVSCGIIVVLMAEKTTERHVTVLMPLGLHLRPADMLVKTASGFQSRIELCRPNDNERFDAKSILSLLTVAAIQGTELIVRATGEDADQAANEIARLFANGFGELDSPPAEE